MFNLFVWVIYCTWAKFPLLDIFDHISKIHLKQQSVLNPPICFRRICNLELFGFPDILHTGYLHIPLTFWESVCYEENKAGKLLINICFIFPYSMYFYIIITITIWILPFIMVLLLFCHFLNDGHITILALITRILILD